MKYQVKYNNQVEKFNATRFASFGNFVQSCIDNKIDCKYFIDNKEVSFSDALNEVNLKHNEWLNNKRKNYKEIYVSKGATKLNNTYQKIWIRK